VGFVVEVALGAGVLQTPWFSLDILPNAPFLSSIIWGWYNEPLWLKYYPSPKE
jgi:hypothetical protein